MEDRICIKMDCEFRMICYHCEWHEHLQNSDDGRGCRCIMGEMCKNKKEIRKDKLNKLNESIFGK